MPIVHNSEWFKRLVRKGYPLPNIECCEIDQKDLFSKTGEPLMYFDVLYFTNKGARSVKVSAHYYCERLFPDPDEKPEILEGQLAWKVDNYKEDVELKELPGNLSKRGLVILRYDATHDVLNKSLFDLDDYNVFIIEDKQPRNIKTLSMNHGHILSIRFCSTENFNISVYSPYFSFLIFIPHKRLDRGYSSQGFGGSIIPIQPPDSPTFHSPDDAKRYLETSEEYREIYNSIYAKMLTDDGNKDMLY